ncbi:uncharacterized protein BDV17DRAFT_270975 [Aspergillus undulatus]|uniref:uncharacterized protein n=1 Tax=Aspergillus undulatus TaxID=1810928 RepID=UPI003CCE3D29
MAAPQTPAPVFDTWSLVRSLFAREQHHLHQIAQLEKALSTAGTKNQNERLAYNTLQGHYESLQRSYNALHADYQRLRHDLQSWDYNNQCQCYGFTGTRVEEVE